MQKAQFLDETEPVSWKTLNACFMPHTLNHDTYTGICLYFSVFWSVIFHTTFNQTRQSSINAAALCIHLLIPVFIHIYTKLPFLMYLLNYSFTDESIWAGIHLQTDWKTFSVISVSSNNGYCYLFSSLTYQNHRMAKLKYFCS